MSMFESIVAPHGGVADGAAVLVAVVVEVVPRGGLRFRDEWGDDD